SRSASRRVCVDLPEPSPPSKVMNLPDAMANKRLTAGAPCQFLPLLRSVLRQPPGGQAQDGIEAAPHWASLVHVLRHEQRHLVHRLRRCCHPQHRHLLTLLQRRLQRPLIHDIGPQLLVCHVARQPDVHVALAGQRHVHALATPYARVSNDFPASNSLVSAKARKPHSSNRRASSRRSSAVASPAMTAIRRRPSCLAAATMP